MIDLQVVNVDPITRQVTLGVKPRSISGISKLTQIVVLSLLNDPDRDVFDPDKGGGMPSLVGSNINPKDSTDLFGEIAMKVKKTENEIITDQMGLGDIPSEKLRELQIIDIAQGVNADEVLVKLRLINQSGQVSDIMV